MADRFIRREDGFGHSGHRNIFFSAIEPFYIFELWRVSRGYFYDFEFEIVDTEYGFLIKYGNLGVCKIVRMNDRFYMEDFNYKLDVIKTDKEIVLCNLNTPEGRKKAIYYKRVQTMEEESVEKDQPDMLGVDFPSFSDPVGQLDVNKHGKYKRIQRNDKESYIDIHEIYGVIEIIVEDKPT